MDPFTGVALAIRVVDWLSAAVAAGLNAAEALQRVSTLLASKHAAGETVTREDLMDLFAAGDVLEDAVRAKVEAALP
jgi:hypothetical protein